LGRRRNKREPKTLDPISSTKTKGNQREKD